MYWADAIREYTTALKPVTTTPPLMQRMLGLIDLTSLNTDDTEAGIAAFCQKAQLPFGHVAAICVYPQFVRLVSAQFAGTPVKVATVVNFPEGASPLDEVLIEISNALQDGAQEIDVVFPYLRYLAGERQYAHTFIAACKAACGDQIALKVILETGALMDPVLIADASLDALTSGADFIKTRSAAWRPRARGSVASVVSAGVLTAASGMSSKPVTAKSRPAAMPRAPRPSINPSATASL